MTKQEYEKTQADARLQKASPIGWLLADTVLCQERDGSDRTQEIIQLAHKFTAIAGKQPGPEERILLTKRPFHTKSQNRKARIAVGEAAIQASTAAWKAVEAAVKAYVAIQTVTGMGEGLSREDAEGDAKDIVRDNYRDFGG